jgi:hypothetical protein
LDIKKEADYFGDIIIVPYMDHYDLVVVKTIAIAEYGVSNGRLVFYIFYFLHLPSDFCLITDCY